MKVTINWGFWIVVSFVLFAAGTFIMVYISMTTSVDLVTDNYYEKELQYQNHIELVKNTNALEQKIDVELSPASLMLKFPNIDDPKKYSGTIYFFRPSDKRGDFSREINIDSTFIQSLDLVLFSKGLWRVKISWNVREQQYYSELPVIIH